MSLIVRPYAAGDAAAIAPNARERDVFAGSGADRRARLSWEAWSMTERGSVIACAGITQNGRAWAMFAEFGFAAARLAIRFIRAVLARAPMQTIVAAARCDQPEAVKLMWALGFAPQRKFEFRRQSYWLYARAGLRRAEAASAAQAGGGS